MSESPLLELENLSIARAQGQELKVLVHGLNLRLYQGESLGVVGESGSGKSLTVKAMLGLLPEPALTLKSGRVLFAGQDLAQLDRGTLNQWRGSRFAVIVQDALAALNPVRRIGAQMREVFRFHGISANGESHARIISCLRQLGFHDCDRVLRAFPHELSGGMRQRVLLAQALLLDPELIIADEPTTALDVSLQARLVNTLKELQQQGRSLLFISHDFGLVLELCERVIILYRGHVLESGPTEDMLRDPWHPYTQAMMKTLPQNGRMPMSHDDTDESAQDEPSCCPYVQTCPIALAVCRQSAPVLMQTGARSVACHARL